MKSVPDAEELVIMSKQDSVVDAKAPKVPRDTSAVGLNPFKRDAIGTAMRVLTSARPSTG